MSEPVNALNLLDSLGREIEDPRDAVWALRRACGWDGEGDPPAVVIRSDGTLAELTQEFPPAGGLSLRAVTTEGSDR